MKTENRRFKLSRSSLLLLASVSFSVFGSLNLEAKAIQPSLKACKKQCEDNFVNDKADRYHDFQLSLNACVVQNRCVWDDRYRINPSCNVLCVSDTSDRAGCMSCQDTADSDYEAAVNDLKNVRDACNAACSYQSPVQFGTAIILQN